MDRLTARRAKVGQTRLNLAFPQSRKIVGHGFIFVKADLAGVGADKTFIEDAAGELIKMFGLNGAEHSGADFGGGGDGFQRETAEFALLTKFFSERTHG
jgi:hypothetical protein